MIPTCLLCHKSFKKSLVPYLCLYCFSRLQASKGKDPFHSLYRYNKEMRRLILEVKIRGNYRALHCLKYLFLNSKQTLDLSNHCRTIIPAPSSLWSRMRGKFDLAWVLAAELANLQKAKLQAPPFHTRWKLQKRSKLRKRSPLASQTYQSSEDASILIVDDVFTTGYTLSHVARSLESSQCCFLTLASAFHR